MTSESDGYARYNNDGSTSFFKSIRYRYFCSENIVDIDNFSRAFTHVTSQIVFAILSSVGLVHSNYVIDPFPAPAN